MKKLNPMLIVVLLITFCLLNIYLIWVYSLLNDNNNILESNKDILQLSIASLWLLMTILWFYFWYKKYERDKELEIIEKYTEKYNKIINNKIINNKELLNLYYEEFFLYSKWYISEELWLEWKYWIWSDINGKILDNINNKKNNDSWKIWLLETLLDNFYMYKIQDSSNLNNKSNNKYYKSHNFVKIDNQNFVDFILVPFKEYCSLFQNDKNVFKDKRKQIIIEKIYNEYKYILWN